MIGDQARQRKIAAQDVQHDDALGRQLAGLRNDVLGYRQLAEVVQAAREPCELDLLLIEAEALRERLKKLKGPLGFLR